MKICIFFLKIAILLTKISLGLFQLNFTYFSAVVIRVYTIKCRL